VGVDFAGLEGKAFGLEQLPLAGQAGGEAGEGAVGADDAMAGDMWGVGVVVEGIADGAVGLGAELAGDLAVGGDFAAGYACGECPDLLAEGHARAEAAGLDVLLEHGRGLCPSDGGWARRRSVCRGRRVRVSCRAYLIDEGETMSGFPRTEVGGLSVSRLIIGTNWFLGWSHTTAAKDAFIKEHVTERRKIADIIEVFLRRGVDTIMGLIQHPPLAEAIAEAEQRAGVKAIIVSTPSFPATARTPMEGFDNDECRRILDQERAMGTAICMPHTSITDKMVDACTREVRKMDGLCRMIRERGMIPGLSTHMPEAITYADETGLDVETYIAIYNTMGFLMHLEVDWIAKLIRQAKKPVMTIKPMAAGQVRPFQGLTFVWNTIREQDMVTVGTMTPREAEECMDLSLAILEGRQAEVPLQETRSKASVKGRG